MEIAALGNDDLTDAVVKENFARENVVMFTNLSPFYFEIPNVRKAAILKPSSNRSPYILR